MTMLRKYLMIVFVCLFSGVAAQAYYTQEDIDAATPFYVVEAALTVYPVMDASRKPLMQLHPGAEITVLKYEKFERIDGAVCCSWYKIRYEQNGADGEGYIMFPGPDSPDHNGLRFEDVSFKFRYDYGNDASGMGVMTVEAIDKTGNVSLCRFEVYGESTASSRLTAWGETGFSNVELVLQLSLSPESCAPSYEYYFAWTGKALVLLAKAGQMWDIPPEGDWYAEYVLLPMHGAPANTIIKAVYFADEFNVTDAEPYPLDGNDIYPLKEEYALEMYRWDGAKVVPVKQNPAIIERAWN